MKNILKRKSVRKYTDLDIQPDIIKKILEAAMAAPSAGNQQPWHFIVMNQRELLDAVPEFHQYAKMIKQAPCAILVCGDLKLEKHKDFWVQDCSAATQNILLAVNSLGLGSVWLGIYPREQRVEGLKKLLKLPEEIIPFSLIPIGGTDEEMNESTRYNPERIHYNGW